MTQLRGMPYRRLYFRAVSYDQLLKHHTSKYFACIFFNVPVSQDHIAEIRFSLVPRMVGISLARRSTLQLFEHRPLSTLARCQARRRGFPRLPPPISPEVPDVFLQFLLAKRKRCGGTARDKVQQCVMNSDEFSFSRTRSS